MPDDNVLARLFANSDIPADILPIQGSMDIREIGHVVSDPQQRNVKLPDGFPSDLEVTQAFMSGLSEQVSHDGIVAKMGFYFD